MSLDEKEKSEAQESAPAAPAGEEPGAPPKKNKGGRPRKDAAAPRAEGIQGPAPSRPRKGADEYRDTAAGVRRELDRLRMAVEAHRQAHPETQLDTEIGSALVELGFRPLPEVEVPPPELFAMMIQGPLTTIAGALDVSHAVPPADQFEVAGNAWHEAAKAYGVSPRWLVLAAAIMSTLGLAAPIIAARIAGDTDSKRKLLPRVELKTNAPN